jgi:hypothetical protein
MGKKKKRPRMTPEERAALEARSEDLGRRLEEMIERYRVRIARKRAEGQT